MAKKKKTKKAVKGVWSKSEVNLLKKLFANNPTAKIAARLGRPTEAVKKKASRMGLRKSKKYMKSLGRG
jgi:transcriptional regulator of aromatic amino acid metabolism